MMTQTSQRFPVSVPRPNEQRKVEKLLLRLAQIQPISGKAAPISFGKSALEAA